MLTPSNAPQGRQFHSVSYDPIGDRMFAFGGSSGTILSDTWALPLAAPTAWVPLSGTRRKGHSALDDSAEYKFPDAAVGQATYGLPGWTRQADVLRALAPIMTARDDTFTIRAYGDARDKSGNITARATCEAVVRRTAEYLDPADLPELTGTPTRPINQAFGRRFQLVSFRWLSPAEL